MQLKDEVVVLTATVKARDTQLQTSQEATAKLKADLADARQQVQVMQERIDDLADELEMERSAATAGDAGVMGFRVSMRCCMQTEQ